MTDSTPVCDEGEHFPVDPNPLPLDPNDWPVADLFAATGVPEALTFPAVINVPQQSAVLDQGVTPQCTVFATASAMHQEEYKLGATAAANFDTQRLFTAAHGTSQGANARDVFTICRDQGYPTVGHNDGAAHKLKAYYSVPQTDAGIKSALLGFGDLLVATAWFHSWFHPLANGQLPPPDYLVGYHLIVQAGTNDNPRLGDKDKNSWNAGWGMNGYCYVPYAYRKYRQGTFKLIHA